MRQPGGSREKSLDLPERQETLVSGCARSGDSFLVCPQKAEHHLNELQRWARAAAISSDPRDEHEPLMLLLPPPRILCASTGHYLHTPRGLCSTPLPRSRNSGTTSLGEDKAHLRMLQRHPGLCCLRLTLHSNCDYRTPPSPRPE